MQKIGVRRFKVKPLFFEDFRSLVVVLTALRVTEDHVLAQLKQP